MLAFWGSIDAAPESMAAAVAPPPPPPPAAPPLPRTLSIAAFDPAETRALLRDRVRFFVHPPSRTRLEEAALLREVFRAQAALRAAECAVAQQNQLAATLDCALAERLLDGSPPSQRQESDLDAAAALVRDRVARLAVAQGAARGASRALATWRNAQNEAFLDASRVGDDRARGDRFFCLTENSASLGGKYCRVLERGGWRPWPAAPARAAKGAPPATNGLLVPFRLQLCDYCDARPFSKLHATFDGSQRVEDKVEFYERFRDAGLADCMPETWILGRSRPREPGLYFVKEATLNFGAGVEVCELAGGSSNALDASIAALRARVDDRSARERRPPASELRGVVQRGVTVAKFRGKNACVRVYLAAIWRGSLAFYAYGEGYVVTPPKPPGDEASSLSECHSAHGRTARTQDCPAYVTPERRRQARALVEACAGVVAGALELPPAKPAERVFEVFGLDVVFDDRRAYLLEANRQPATNEVPPRPDQVGDDEPMLRKLFHLVDPDLLHLDGRDAESPDWEPLDVGGPAPADRPAPAPGEPQGAE